jgi:nucleoside-diphosphate-sugar epimerase
LSSFFHVEDAASATVAALECAPGTYNIVDDHLGQQRVWLLAFASSCWAAGTRFKSPSRKLWRLPAPTALYCATRLRGASNEKARLELNFCPRPLERNKTTHPTAHPRVYFWYLN